VSAALRACFLVLAAVALAECGGGKQADACAGCAGCCSAGACVPGTGASACGSGGGACSACSTGQSCQAGQCAAPSGSGIGSKCAVDADCGGGGSFCASREPGGGYCTKDCTPSGATCPSRSACIAVSATSKLCLETCNANADCRVEHLCFTNAGGSLCLPKCTRDADCASANCDVPSGTCNASRVGNGCASDADCGDKPAFCTLSMTNGYCSLPCGGDPATAAACPSGSNCASLGGTGSACLKACTDDTQCSAGALCSDTGSGVKSCVPKCTADLDCGATLKCNVGTGACVSGGPAPGQLGGVCGASSDCPLGGGAFCATGYPGGYCSIDCTADHTVCGAAGICVAFSGGFDDCLSKCATRRDCRAGYACAGLSGGAGAVCAPACVTNADCGAALACDRTSGLCVTPSVGSSTVTSIDLTASGPVAVHTTTLSAPLTLTVPTDAISVTFVGQAADPTARIVVYRIESPDGRIYDYATPGSPMKILPPAGPGAFAVLAPNSPAAPFTPGTWTLELIGAKETTATVQALVKKSAQSPLATGSIDLNLFFVGMPGISAASAPADANFKTVLDSVRSTWSQIGIGVGNLTYHDITGADLQRFGDLNEPDLGALMQRSLTPGANDNALNVFFVHSISGGGLQGYIILGESAGIPGVPVRGTTGSGLAVTTADFPNGLADIADTWVHEGSHWLGLFHTTESAGTAFDSLPDTPECHASPNDTDSDRIMQPSECVNFDAGNEMFWTSTAAIPHSHLSANQQFVLLRNPAVH